MNMKKMFLMGLGVMVIFASSCYLIRFKTFIMNPIPILFFAHPTVVLLIVFDMCREYLPLLLRGISQKEKIARGMYARRNKVKDTLVKEKISWRVGLHNMFHTLFI